VSQERAARSCLRELMSSLVNTLPKMPFDGARSSGRVARRFRDSTSRRGLVGRSALPVV
jgi:hypothetical protein